MAINREQELLSEAEELCYGIGNGISMIDAISTAIEGGCSSGKEFAGALNAAYEYLDVKQKALRVVVDGLYDEMRNRP